MRHLFITVLCLSASVFISLPAKAQVLTYQVKQCADVKNDAKGQTNLSPVDYRLIIDQLKKVIIIYAPSQTLRYHISKVYFDNSSVILVCTSPNGHSFMSTLRRLEGSIHPMWLTMEWGDAKWNFMMDITSEK